MTNEQTPVVAAAVETVAAPVAETAPVEVLENVSAPVVETAPAEAVKEKSLYDNYMDIFLAKVDEFKELCLKGSTNKSKALKARKLSLFLTEEFLNFRKLSVKNDKDELKDASEVKLVGNER